MKKRGAPSAAELTVVRVSNDRLEPPDNMTESEQAEWTRIVNSMPTAAFRPSDIPLLRTYVKRQPSIAKL